MRAFVAAGIAAAGLITAVAMAQSEAPRPQGRPAGMQAAQAIASWQAKPKEVAQTMIGKYGQPQEVTASRLIWHNNGPWKFTELVNEEIAHDFPVPHKDMLVQMINYRIDPGRADELLAYDGSLILERTKGEIGARCDKEEANFLAVNLAHDVATGTRSVDDARAFYAASIAELMKTGKKNDYLQGFRFSVPAGDQGDPDKPFK